MVKEFSCPRCGYTTSKKSNIKNHLLRKKMCKPMLIDIIPKEYVDEILKGNKTTNDKLEKKIKELQEKLTTTQIDSSSEMEELRKENLRLQSVIDRFNSKNHGHIYIFKNAMFSTLGENIYKVGCSSNPKPSILLYTSQKFINKLKAEKHLFRLIDKKQS